MYEACVRGVCVCVNAFVGIADMVASTSSIESNMAASWCSGDAGGARGGMSPRLLRHAAGPNGA